jgi:hypothetical protein
MHLTTQIRRSSLISELLAGSKRRILISPTSRGLDKVARANPSCMFALRLCFPRFFLKMFVSFSCMPDIGFQQGTGLAMEINEKLNYSLLLIMQGAENRGIKNSWRKFAGNESSRERFKVRKSRECFLPRPSRRLAPSGSSR